MAEQRHFNTREQLCGTPPGGRGRALRLPQTVAAGVLCHARRWQLVLEQPVRLVLAQGREVRPPPGLAPAGPRLPPRPEGLLARLLGLPVWVSPRPLRGVLGSSPQRLENEVHAARPLHPGGDGDFLDDLGVAGRLGNDDVGPGGQQSPVVTVGGCGRTERNDWFSDLGSGSTQRRSGTESEATAGSFPPRPSV